jgi:hypothetical protein
MKTNIFRFTLSIVIVSLFLAGMVSNTSAQGLSQFGITPTPAGSLPTVPPPALDVVAGTPIQTATFASLDAPDTTLNGPYDSMTVDFSLPPNWELLDGTEVQFFISAFAVSSGADNLGDTLGATLDVTFNGRTVTSLILKSGTDVEYRVKIPVDALRSTRSDGRHVLYLFLDAGIDCDFDFHKTTVVVGGKSQFLLPYAERSVNLDLGNLPQPIYQSSPIVPSQAVIVVPNSPSADVLRAAMITSAGFGRMSNGRLLLNLISADQLTEAFYTTSHLIFVGKPSDFGMISTLGWPAPVSGGQFAASSGMQADDGILQEIVSPWNPGRILLWVSGASDVGIVKAAQALSTGAVKPIFERNKIVIADTQPFAAAAEAAALNAPVERTFTDLGYQIETATGAGFSEINYEFYVPPGMAPSDKPYIDLIFSSSALLDPALSGMVIFVNNIQIGSERLSEETSVLTTKRVTIPQNVVRTGTNEIRIEVTLIPNTQCSLFNFSNLWMTVFPESLIHIALAPATATSDIASSLQDYPSVFTTYPNLGNVGFVLPKDDVVAWRTGAQVAFDLGRQVRGALFELGVFYDGEITDEQRANHDLFLVGQPANLPSITELADQLPVAFEAGNNLAIIEGEGVVYRVPANVSLGYLELLPSPWGQARVIVAILGSNAEGLAFAGNGLTLSNRRSGLFGNFAVITAQDEISASTITGAGVSSLTNGVSPIATAVVIKPSPGGGVAVPGQTLLTRTDYIPMALLVIVLLVGVLMFFALRSNRKNGNGS